MGRLKTILNCIGGKYFSCYRKKDEIFYSVALKKPSEKKYCYYDNEINNNSFIIKENINEWINEVFTKNNNKWTHQLLYNDEIPEEFETLSKNYTKGHNKGILLWNDTKIGWLIHSVPKYPNKIEFESEFKIEDIHESQLIYGQSFAYLEFDIKELKNILFQLKLMESHVYFTNYDLYSKLENIESNKVREVKIDTNIVHISKHTEWYHDLYDNFIRNFMDSKILCQTWAKPPIESSEFTKNIKTMKWNDKISYNTNQDHSKYAISMDSNKPWVFVGDINRMESQYKRGGGGILIKNKDLWNCFNKIIINYSEIIENPNKV
jgi:deoxyribonuclease-2